MPSDQQRRQRFQGSGPNRQDRRRRLGGGGAGMSVGPPVPVRLVDHPGAAAGGTGMGGEPAAAVDAQGVDADPVTVWVGMNLQLDSLPGPDQPGGNRVAAGLEGDQAVLPDPSQVLLGNQIGLVRQPPERGPISLSPDGDDLAVSAMHLGSANRQPGVERPAELT